MKIMKLIHELEDKNKKEKQTFKDLDAMAILINDF